MSQLVRFYGPMIISYMTMMVIMILAFQMRRQMIFKFFRKTETENLLIYAGGGSKLKVNVACQLRK
jgi:hypothetical protein